jgi:hypothetical protein
MNEGMNMGPNPEEQKRLEKERQNKENAEWEKYLEYRKGPDAKYIEGLIREKGGVKQVVEYLGLNGEEDLIHWTKAKQEKRDAERAEAYFVSHPEQLVTPTTLKEAGPEIAEFEGMIASFESTHSLEKLHSIVDLSPDLTELFNRADDLEDPEREKKAIETYEKHNPGYVAVYKENMDRARAIVLSPEDTNVFETRRAAKKDLKKIKEKLDVLQKNTSISKDKYEELKNTYRPLARALGSIKINTNRVDHS